MQSRLLIAIILIAGATDLLGKGLVCGGTLAPCELYSFIDSAGHWRFSLLPMPSGVALSADQVLDKRFWLNGVEELESVIAKMPKGTCIAWGEQPGRGTWIKRKETFGYPPERIMQRILWFAEQRKITIGTDTRKPRFKLPGDPTH